MANELDTTVPNPKCYADTLRESEHAILAAFLRNGASQNQVIARSTTLHVVDCLNWGVISSEVKVPYQGGVQRDFIRLLEEVPPGARYRFLL